MLNSPLPSDFVSVITANQRLVFKICNAYCQNAGDREDLAQEIIFQLWKSWGSFNYSVKLSTWMYRIALNVAISFYRKNQKSASTVAMDERVFEIADEHFEDGLEENLTVLQQLIGALKPLDKALMLLYLEEKPHQEIAEIIGITPTNVATKISRIKEQLKQEFNKKA